MAFRYRHHRRIFIRVRIRAWLKAAAPLLITIPIAASIKIFRPDYNLTFLSWLVSAMLLLGAAIHGVWLLRDLKELRRIRLRYIHSLLRRKKLIPVPVLPQGMLVVIGRIRKPPPNPNNN